MTKMMDLEMVENKIHKHNMYQEVGLNKETFRGVSLLIQSEFSKIRSGMLEIPDDFDVSLDINDREIFLVVKDSYA